MRAIVVRHYKTLSNAHRRIMGWADTPPAANWEQDLAYVERALHRRDVTLDAVYSSSLGRARNTAQYYADKRGILAPQEDAGLNEVNYGSLSHKPKQWVVEHCPEYKSDPDYVYPDGESFRQMQQRSVEAFLRIAQRHESETVLIVAHAGVIRGLICHLLGLDLGAHLKRKVSHRYLGDFLIRNDTCTYYDEVGIRSGFVRDDVVRLPWQPGQRGGLLADRTEPSSLKNQVILGPGSNTLDNLAPACN